MKDLPNELNEYLNRQDYCANGCSAYRNYLPDALELFAEYALAHKGEPSLTDILYGDYDHE